MSHHSYSTPLEGYHPANDHDVAVVKATPFVWRDLGEIPPRDWLYGKCFIRNIMNLTVAPGGFGKSSLVIAEVLAMASGKPILGHAVRSPLRVWLFNGEDPREEMERCVGAAMKALGLTAEDIGDRLLLDIGSEQQFVIAKQSGGDGTTIVEPVKDGIIAQIKAHKMDALILDPFVSTHAVPENDNNSVEIAARAWRDVADQTNAAVELVHHAKKTVGQEVNAESSRGGIAFVAAARDVRVLNQMSKNEATAVGVEKEQARSYFRVYLDKANVAPPSEGADWYELRGTCLDNGAPGRDADWVGVVFPFDYTPKGLFERFTDTQLTAAQEANACAKTEQRQHLPKPEVAG